MIKRLAHSSSAPLARAAHLGEMLGGLQAGGKAERQFGFAQLPHQLLGFRNQTVSGARHRQAAHLCNYIGKPSAVPLVR
jgi:hypothetical protein